MTDNAAIITVTVDESTPMMAQKAQPIPAPTPIPLPDPCYPCDPFEQIIYKVDGLLTWKATHEVEQKAQFRNLERRVETLEMLSSSPEICCCTIC